MWLFHQIVNISKHQNVVIPPSCSDFTKYIFFRCVSVLTCSRLYNLIGVYNRGVLTAFEGDRNGCVDGV